MALTKRERRQRIKFRIRARLNGTTECPRMSVYRSNKEIYVQIVNDEDGKTIMSVSSRDKGIADHKGNKTEVAQLVGKAIAEKATKEGITKVVFDRNGYLYHGRVKSLANAAREGGLKF